MQIKTDLKLGEHILHVYRWHAHTLNPDCLSVLPVIVYIIQHIVSQTISP